MRKLYVLETVRRHARGLAGEVAAPGGRRRTLVLLAAVVSLSIGAFWIWRLWLAPPDEPVAVPTAPVPEHQRSGPLANPWGGGAPVTSARVEEGATSVPAPVAAASSAALPASAGTRSGSVPPAREAVRQALAQLRGGGNVVEFVSAAVQGGDTAALAVLWMAERQCRQWTHWRQVNEWRNRAVPGRAALGAAPGAGAAAACESMPEAGQVEAALAAAGFPAAVDNPTELTRRPLDLALAVAVGDPLLLAEVLEATEGERIAAQLRSWGADARDLGSSEVQRAAVWLASCTPLDATGRPGTSAALLPACREHPALWQACLHQGLCEVRDLRDLLLRTLPANELGVAERLARWLAPRMGR